MAENTEISWADDTFNPWEGCQKVGPGCDGCYAEARNARYAGNGVAAPNWGPGAPRRRTSESNWKKPLRWAKELRAKIAAWIAGGGVGPKPQRFVFCSSLADVFDNAVDPQWRADLFDLIRATPELTWLLLTKRPGNIVKLFIDCQPGDRVAKLSAPWPRNAAIGCTIVNQEEADRDIPKLLHAKEALNPAFAFLSMEPLLGPVFLASLNIRDGEKLDCLAGVRTLTPPLGGGSFYEDAQKVDWVITGFETDQGPHKARPGNRRWAAWIRDQCAAASVSYHHKQNGEWLGIGEAFEDGNLNYTGRADDWHYFTEGDDCASRVGKKRAGRMLYGAHHDARPEVAR